MMNRDYLDGFRQGVETAEQILDEYRAPDLSGKILAPYPPDIADRLDYLRGFSEGLRAVTQSKGITMYGVLDFVDRYSGYDLEQEVDEYLAAHRKERKTSGEPGDAPAGG